MEIFLLFIKGLGVGVAVAAPVGPIGVLCVRRTLDSGVWTGLLSGLGAAGADAFYGAVAAFGVTAISALLVDYQDHLRLGGGVFLLALGTRTFVSPPAQAAAAPQSGRLAGAFMSCFLLTLTNPMTVIAFVAIFAGLGLASHGANYAATVIVVGGVFLGSAAWWLALSGLVGLWRKRITPGTMVWVNRASGGIIAAFGGGALVTALI